LRNRNFLELFLNFILSNFVYILFFFSPVSSPNNIPHGLRFSTLSKITFNTAIVGINKNIPDIPASAPPINTPKIDINAFIFTFELTTFGIMILLSIN